MLLFVWFISHHNYLYFILLRMDLYYASIEINIMFCSVLFGSFDILVFCVFFVCFFSVRLLLVLHGRSFFSSPPQRPMTSDFEGFLYQILSIALFSYLNSWERILVNSVYVLVELNHVYASIDFITFCSVLSVLFCSGHDAK